MQNKKKLLKTILRLFALILVAVFLGFNIYMWNAQSLTGNALPMPFGCGVAIVLSGSMEPALSVNDLIFVKAQDCYQVGDVVVFQNGGSLVVHRILELNGDTVVTQGDANNTPDEEMALSRILGRVTGHINGLGSVVRVLKSPAVSIGLLVLSIFLMDRSYKKEKRQGDDELEQIKEEIRRLKEEQAE